jgi:hypothetical protein
LPKYPVSGHQHNEHQRAVSDISNMTRRASGGLTSFSEFAYGLSCLGILKVFVWIRYSLLENNN